MPADRPPPATNYSPLPNQDIVYLSMNKTGKSSPPYFGKTLSRGGNLMASSPPRVQMSELSKHKPMKVK